MRFNGNVIENLQAAAKSKDKYLIKDIIIDEMSNIIDSNPDRMIKALRESKVDVSDNVSKQKLIKLASRNLHNNRIFQKNLAVIIVKKGNATPHDFSSSNGKGTEGASSGGSGGGGNIISSIADMVGSISQWGASSKDLKAEEQRSKNAMYEKIFGGKKKTNWLPIVVIAGVLVIGGIVVWKTTGKK